MGYEENKNELRGCASVYRHEQQDDLTAIHSPGEVHTKMLKTIDTGVRT